MIERKSSFRNIITCLGVLIAAPSSMAADPAVTNLLKNSIEKGVATQTTSPGQKSMSASSFSASSSGDTTIPGTNMSAMILDKLKVTEQVTPETTALFGETVDLNTGTLSLQQVDVSIPGNFNIPVEFRRIFRGGRYASFTNLDLGEWAIGIPSISTTIIYDHITWQQFSGNWGSGNMCSGQYNPGNFAVGPVDIKTIDEYWSGETLDIPGVVNERIQVKNGNERFVKNWRFSCTRSSFAGTSIEGLKATSPQGITYEFTQPKLIPTAPITATNGIGYLESVARYNAFLLVSKITDRFGNSVNYNYENGELTSITSSDGRSIAIAYEMNSFQKSRVKSVSANGQTWSYSYRNSTHPLKNDALISVTRPDQKQWQFDISEAADIYPGVLNTTQKDYIYHFKPKYDGAGTWIGTDKILLNIVESQCILPKSGDNDPVSSTGFIIHPNGARLDLSFRVVQFGRSNVPRALSDTRWGTIHANDLCFGTYAIAKKKLSGPGLTTLNWIYSYSQNKGGWAPAAPGFVDESEPLTGLAVLPSNYLLKDLRSTTITSPDGSKTKHVFSRKWDHTDGQEVVTEYYDTDGSSLLQRVERLFSAVPTGGNAGFESFTGPELGWPFLVDNPASHENYINKTKEVIYTYKSSVLADTYTTDYSNFNAYGVPTTVVERNSFRPEVRTTTTTYDHDLTNWVLNLETDRQVSQSGQTISERSATYYGPTTPEKSLKRTESIYGRYVATYAYHSFGGLAKTTYALPNRWIAYNDYKRGHPRDIRIPNRYFTGEIVIRSDVNDNGSIAWAYDLNGNRTDYQYDALGRLTFVNPLDPRWADTVISYNSDATGRGALVQTVSRGNSRKSITLDALLQPILTKTWDANNEAGTVSFVNQQFNAYGKVTFASVPSNNSYETFGTVSLFDGLQRPISQTNTANGDVTYSYESSNTTKVTNGRGLSTSTAYLAFGNPIAEKPVFINQPEGVTTSITYNIANLPSSIVQGGTTEIRLYNENMDLCLQKRPETGVKVMTYNNLGQVSSFAEGLSPLNSGADSCSNYSASPEAWVNLSYDNLGDLSTQTYKDNITPTKTVTLDAQGNLKQLKAGDIVWDYAFNTAHLVETETLTLDQKTFVVGSSYNALGHLTQKRYPGGLVIDYSVNALGDIETVKEGTNTLASNIVYHPNGQIESFTYGNQLRFTQSLDNKKRPYERQVSVGFAPTVSQRYQYDAVNNIEFIVDPLNAQRTLSLTYDGLDRLATASAGIFGNMGFGYDTLGNITQKRVFSTTSNYTYDGTTKRLANAMGYQFSYDSRGNVTSNGTRSFTFNRANQLTSSGALQYAYDGHGRRVKQLKSNQNTYSVYDLTGTLLYRGNPETKHTNSVYLGKQLLAELDSGGAAQAPAKPTISINLSTAKVRGQCSIWDLDCPDVRNVYYSWGSSNASSCQGNLSQTTSFGAQISSMPISGTSQISTTQSYPANDALFTLTLTCQGPGGATTESRTVAGTGSNGDEM